MNDTSITTGQYTFRRATIQDVYVIALLFDAVNEHYHAPGWGKGIYPTAASIRDVVTKKNLYILMYNYNPIGVCTLDHEQHPAYAFQPWQINVPVDQVIVVHDLAVHPNHQRKGIGKRLVKEIIDFARNHQSVTIRLDTHLDNIPARKLYESCGFHEIAQWTGVVLNITQTFYIFEYLL